VATVLGRLLDWPKDERAELVATTVKAAADRPEPVYQVVARLNEDHPGDVGAVCSLLLNHVVLAPGQAMFMPAGGLHAYVHGTGVELMANSDNVLRAGLTPKRVDVPELLRIVNPKIGVPVVTPRQAAPGVDVFELPVPEIRLTRLTLVDGTADVPGEGPRIVLCVDGAVAVSAAGATLPLDRGASCFVPASDGPITAGGEGLAFVAAAGI
jgi:mannose-6-phosphate isomerase